MKCFNYCSELYARTNKPICQQWLLLLTEVNLAAFIAIRESEVNKNNNLAIDQEIDAYVANSRSSSPKSSTCSPETEKGYN
jgi:hypothetical protein